MLAASTPQHGIKAQASLREKHDVQIVKSRFREIEAMVAGRKDTETENRMAEFVNRHGQVHVYRDNLYSSSAEARKAMREDTEAIPADHDYIVDLFERAFPSEGYIEDIYEELVRYMRSQDHRDALAFSKEMGGRTGSLKRHDQIVRMVANAQHKLAAFDDPLPERLYDKLGVSKSYLTKLMTGKERNKAMIREALREAMYQLCPSKRPRKRRAQIAAAEASTLPPSMAQCAPGCQCIRHQA